jgi:hypothetical protein
MSESGCETAAAVVCESGRKQRLGAKVRERLFNFPSRGFGNAKASLLELPNQSVDLSEVPVHVRGGAELSDPLKTQTGGTNETLHKDLTDL